MWDCTSFLDKDIWRNRNNFNLYKSVKSVLIFGDPSNIESPLFSIIIPTYKRPVLLKEAVSSALNQECSISYEVIVIDNNPIFDEIPESEVVIKEFDNNKLLYYRNEENIGLGNWNRGIELARGKWVIMLHDDDLLSNKHLNIINKTLLKNPDIKLLSVDVQLFDKLNYKSLIYNCWSRFLRIISSSYPIKLSYWHYYLDNPTPNTGCTYHRETLLEIGGFDDRFNPIPDYSLSYKLFYQYGNNYVLNQSLAYYRILENDALNPRTMVGVVIANHFIKDHIRGINPLIKYIDFGYDTACLAWIRSKFEIYTHDFKNDYLDKKIQRIVLPSQILKVYKYLFYFTNVMILRLGCCVKSKVKRLTKGIK